MNERREQRIIINGLVNPFTNSLGPDMRILIATDAWHPQVNGVVRTLTSLARHFLDVTLNARSRGSMVFPCDAGVKKGDELGWFEHGSTIIVPAPENFEFAAGRHGRSVR
jgi:hypothetical protein